MGMSVFLFGEKRLKQDWSIHNIRQYFWKRGSLILVFMFFLEFPGWSLIFFFNASTSVNNGPGLPGSLAYGFPIPSSVLYGLSSCMILGSFLWQLPRIVLLGITAGTFATSAIYSSSLKVDMVFHPLEILLLVPGKTTGAMVICPIIPWIGVTTFGMFWASLLSEYKEKSYTWAWQTGLTMLLIFFLLRLNQWGNFQMNEYHDWISFSP